MIKLSKIFDFLMPRLFFGGGGGPTSSTVTQTNLPEYLKPYVMGMMGRATENLFETKEIKDPETGEITYEVGAPKPYTPYSREAYENYVDPTTGERVNLPSGWESVAGPTQSQQQAVNLANWMGSRDGGLNLLDTGFGRAQQFAEQAGYGGQASADLANYLGNLGLGSGQTGQQLGIAGGAQYGGMGAGYGGAAAGMAPAATQYGEAGAAYGRGAQQTAGTAGGELGNIGLTYGAGAAGLAPGAAGLGGLYEKLATGPEEFGKYMSPYMANVVAQQQEDAVKQKQIADQARASAAARAGAFGGGRQAIERAEADRALQSQLGNIQAEGLQTAYQQAQQNILNRAQLESQGLGQAGQLYGMGMQGAQVGLQGLDRQLAGAQLGMQGAGMGLQGLGQAGQLYGLGMQGAGLGLQGVQQQLAGTAQGMQGAGMGLQGVQTGLGGLGLMGQMGGQAADILGKRFGQYRDIAGFQYGLGEQERQLNQQALNQQIQNFAMMQETPYQRLAAFNALLRGYSQPGQTMTQYQAQPSGVSQLAGLGLAGAGVSGLLGGGRKAGGVIKASDGVDKLALRNALAGK